jgi:hypothetical protein
MEILIGIVSFVVGWILRELYAVHKVKTLLNQIESFEENSEEDEKADIMHINIEKHDGILFVYSSEDDSFMAQGKTREELEKNLRERYPNVIFGASNANLQKVGFK